jgi:sugar lactone lactonase YvrE
VSDFYGQCVLTVAVDGAVDTVCRVPAQPSGLGWRPDGTLLVVSMLDRTLRSWDGVELRLVAALSPWAAGVANDMVVDDLGRAYIGNVGDRSGGIVRPTCLVRVDSDDSIRPVADDLYVPNGSVITPDGSTLIVAETAACRLTAFRIQRDGSLTDRRVWADLTAVGDGKPFEPDGIALDAEGALWVADANGHRALRVREGGKVLDAVETGDESVYALALGGGDGRALFLCCAPPGHPHDSRRLPLGRLRSIRVDVPAARVSAP